MNHLNQWKSMLPMLFEGEKMHKIRTFIEHQKAQRNQVFPPNELIFNAFQLTDWNQLKVVIIGQDPYHGQGEAHGLSFSVPEGIKIPPSLRNIFKELAADIPEFEIPPSGNLTKWAEQGVLLLNAILTVNKDHAASHQQSGWESFTDELIQSISEKKENIVFILWGNFAQSKKKFIDTSKHLVLESVHPSPLSAHRGFLGCKHFSATNAYLREKKLPEIDWKLTTSLFD